MRVREKNSEGCCLVIKILFSMVSWKKSVGVGMGKVLKRKVLKMKFGEERGIWMKIWMKSFWKVLKEMGSLEMSFGFVVMGRRLRVVVWVLISVRVVFSLLGRKVVGFILFVCMVVMISRVLMIVLVAVLARFFIIIFV